MFPATGGMNGGLNNMYSMCLKPPFIQITNLYNPETLSPISEHTANFHTENKENANYYYYVILCPNIILLCNIMP